MKTFMQYLKEQGPTQMSNQNNQQINKQQSNQNNQQINKQQPNQNNQQINKQQPNQNNQQKNNQVDVNQLNNTIAQLKKILLPLGVKF